MLLLPIRTNIWPRRTPYANYALIAINVLIFLLSYGGPFHYQLQTAKGIISLPPVPIRPWAANWLLIPADWHYFQFLTYAFLHGGWLHIGGNMFFLYLFGNNINDKLGNLRYVVFYLTGAFASGVGHTLMNSHSYIPTLGASGAIAAVTGAYLVLYPQTLITILYWFFFIGTVEIPALYFIGLKMIFIDNVIARMTPGVAYDAHLAGYTYGAAVTLLLQASGLLGTSHLDLWAMIGRWNRRRQYRDVVADGYDPFSGAGGRKPIETREIRTPADREKQARIDQLRHEIAQWIAQRNLAAAADLYLELMRVDPEQILPRQYLLDIANQLTSDGRATEAAGAYEQFLKYYRTYEHVGQVELMLGILYSRYLHSAGRAVEHLQRAVSRLSDPGQLQMCRDELARIGAAAE